MANKQPFYHEIQVLFTTTNGIRLSEKKCNQIREIISTQRGLSKQFPIEIMESEPEPGDPADLL